MKGTQGGAGHGGYLLEFANAGSATCALTGYPGVAGLNSAGTVVVNAKRAQKGYLGGAAVTTVTLAPGATASALVEGLNGPTPTGGSCPTITSILVTPPGETHPATLKLPQTLCYPEIHPIVNGPNGGAGQA